MSLRQVQVKVQADARDEILEICRELEITEYAITPPDQDGVCLCLITAQSGRTGSILNEIEKRLGAQAGALGKAAYSAVVLPVEATVPRLEEAKAQDDRQRTAREELIEDVSALIRLDKSFVIFVLISSVIATFGLLADDVAVVIGAMVIAPLLGPALSLSLGIVLADVDLLRRGALAETVGLALALLVSYTAAALLPGYAPELSQQIQVRTHPNLFHLILALGSGFAGALSLMGGTSTALVGVMVAVALLPPTAVVGIGLAAGDLGVVAGAGLLVLANLMGVVLSGILAFRYKGIHPGNWRKVEESKGRTRTVVATIVAVLLLTAVPMSRVTMTTVREATLRANVGQVARSIVPGFGWSLDQLEVDGSTEPPTVRLEVQSPVRPDEETIRRFQRAVYSLLHAPIRLELTVIPVEVWSGRENP